MRNNFKNIVAIALMISTWLMNNHGAIMITDPTRMATKEELLQLETIPMFESLPVDPEYLAKLEAQKELRKKLKEERRKFGNVFSEQLNRLMNHKGIEAAPLSKATGIPESTLHGWINFIVDSVDTSSDLKVISNYFGVTVDFIVYGIAVTDFERELDENMPEIDVPNNEVSA